MNTILDALGFIAFALLVSGFVWRDLLGVSW